MRACRLAGALPLLALALLAGCGAEELCRAEEGQTAAESCAAPVEDETSLLSLTAQVTVRAKKQAKASPAAAEALSGDDPLRDEEHAAALPATAFLPGTPEERIWEAAAPSLQKTLDAVGPDRKADGPFRLFLLAVAFFLCSVSLLFITCLGLLVERLWLSRARGAKAAEEPAAGAAAALLQGRPGPSYGAESSATSAPCNDLVPKGEHLISVDTSFLMRVLNFTLGGKGNVKEKAAAEDDSSDDCSECPRPVMQGDDEEEPESEAEGATSPEAPTVRTQAPQARPQAPASPTEWLSTK